MNSSFLLLFLFVFDQLLKKILALNLTAYFDLDLMKKRFILQFQYNSLSYQN